MMRRRLFFAGEMILLFFFLGVLYFYGQLTTRLEEIESPQVMEQEAEEIVVNESAPRMTGYMTIALFGLDHRSFNEDLSGENSDTIIIASVNNDTRDVKLVSVYRDSLLNIGDETYAKINAAYAYGGPSRAVNALNTNLDLDITDYISVDFQAVTNLVDAVGGLDIPMSYAEVVHMNNYCVETSEETGKEYTPIELPEEEPEDLEAVIGTFHLNGVQATSYCRIRYTANLDMGRTERQRRVIQMVTHKLKTAGITRILKVMDEVFPLVHTSLSKTKILSLLPSMIGYNLNDTTGFPTKYKFSDVRGSIIVADDLTYNVSALHEFLYGAHAGYKPSQTIQRISQQILAIVGGEDELLDEAPAAGNDDNTDVFWTNSDGEDSWVPSQSFAYPTATSYPAEDYDTAADPGNDVYYEIPSAENGYTGGDGYTYEEGYVPGQGRETYGGFEEGDYQEEEQNYGDYEDAAYEGYDEGADYEGGDSVVYEGEEEGTYNEDDGSYGEADFTDGEADFTSGE